MKKKTLKTIGTCTFAGCYMYGSLNGDPEITNFGRDGLMLFSLIPNNFGSPTPSGVSPDVSGSLETTSVSGVSGAFLG